MHFLFISLPVVLATVPTKESVRNKLNGRFYWPPDLEIYWSDLNQNCNEELKALGGLFRVYSIMKEFYPLIDNILNSANEKKWNENVEKAKNFKPSNSYYNKPSDYPQEFALRDCVVNNAKEIFDRKHLAPRSHEDSEKTLSEKEVVEASVVPHQGAGENETLQNIEADLVKTGTREAAVDQDPNESGAIAKQTDLQLAAARDSVRAKLEKHSWTWPSASDLKVYWPELEVCNAQLEALRFSDRMRPIIKGLYPLIDNIINSETRDLEGHVTALKAFSTKDYPLEFALRQCVFKHAKEINQAKYRALIPRRAGNSAFETTAETAKEDGLQASGAEPQVIQAAHGLSATTTRRDSVRMQLDKANIWPTFSDLEFYWPELTDFCDYQLYELEETQTNIYNPRKQFIYPLIDNIVNSASQRDLNVNIKASEDFAGSFLIGVFKENQLLKCVIRNAQKIFDRKHPDIPSEEGSSKAASAQKDQIEVKQELAQELSSIAQERTAAEENETQEAENKDKLKAEKGTIEKANVVSEKKQESGDRP